MKTRRLWQQRCHSAVKWLRFTLVCIGSGTPTAGYPDVDNCEFTGGGLTVGG